MTIDEPQEGTRGDQAELANTPHSGWRIALALAALAVCAAGAWVVLGRAPEPSWSSSSPEAQEAFELGLQARMKLYAMEAQEHFQRAVELDPDFIAAKLALWMYLRHHQPERAGELHQQIAAADLSQATERERALVEHHLAMHDDRPDETRKVVSEYLERFPNDTFLLEIQCDQLWLQGQWQRAEECFRHLIAEDPNWVVAQNLLGYLAMAQGRFAEAEEQFALYRYLAPDQANPHDSLGELMMVTGRWQEAEEHLEKALAAKADFCPSWGHLKEVHVLAGDWEGARQVLARQPQRDTCSQMHTIDPVCYVDAEALRSEGNWEGLWTLAAGERCQGVEERMPIAYFRASLATGREDRADEIEQRVHERYGPKDGEAEVRVSHRVLPTLLDAIRLRHDGEPGKAAELLAPLPEELLFWNVPAANQRLAVEIELWQALEEAGDRRAAQTVLERARAVNPALTNRWKEYPAG
ncbi:MAG: tetratricopeptide repeat protein [Acidobacteriota bacterium]